MIERFNYRSNRDIDLGSEPINGQGTGSVSVCRYGLFPMSYNGCEIIAVYNLRLLLGTPRPLCDIAREIYPYGCLVFGVFGTHPYALKRYFNSNGLPVHMIKDYYMFRKVFAAKRYGILSFWNDTTVFKGLHTVCVENTPEGLKVYNRSNKKTEPVIYNSIDDYMDFGRFICGYYVD